MTVDYADAKLKRLLRAAMKENLEKSKRTTNEVSRTYYDRAVSIYTLSSEILGIELSEGPNDELLKLLH